MLTDETSTPRDLGATADSPRIAPLMPLSYSTLIGRLPLPLLRKEKCHATIAYFHPHSHQHSRFHHFPALNQKKLLN
jgi:hypothetical protein